MVDDRKVLFGVGGPQIHTGLPVNVAEIQAYLHRVEEMGFHSVWVQEQAGLSAGATALEGVTMLSYAAALTQRVRLGAAVFLITLRNPIQLAKSLASLDQLSQGRLIVGVALGAYKTLYGAYGLSAERRVARFNEALTVIEKLWTEENWTFEGQFWQLKNASLLPRPFQKPHPPVWFGGATPAALKRAARRGSGFIGAGSSSTADFKLHVETVLQALAEFGRDPADFMFAKRVYLGVDRDRERAARRLREWFAVYYRRAELADRVAVCGSPEECAERLREIIAAGARLVVLNPVFDMREQLEILASEVVPRISSR